MYNNQVDWEDYHHIKIKEYCEFIYKGQKYFKGTNGDMTWVFNKEMKEIGIYHNHNYIEFY